MVQNVGEMTLASIFLDPFLCLFTKLPYKPNLGQQECRTIILLEQVSVTTYLDLIMIVLNDMLVLHANFEHFGLSVFPASLESTLQRRLFRVSTFTCPKICYSNIFT